MQALQETRFSYPRNDGDTYLSWYRNEFSSVFVATNPFIRVPDFSWTTPTDSISDEVLKSAKRQGEQSAVLWCEIAKMCKFSSIAQVNRALRLTGSKRILSKFASPQDTDLMLKICKEQNILLPDEGILGPSTELSIGRFLKKLGHDEVIVANSFGDAPRKLNSAEFLQPKPVDVSEMHAEDGSTYISVYTDYHYFLVCQTDESRSVANPRDYLEGFFADDRTSDFWGIGDLHG